MTPQMIAVRRWHRLYFAAVGVLAVWVGVWCYFVPGHSERAIPFEVPPLHARLLGAMYFSGFTFMLGALFASRWCEIAVVPTMTAIWTGGLLVVSLLYLDEFDFAKVGVWIWFAAYVIYPLVAVWLARRYASETPGSPREPVLPAWVRRYLLGQGVALSLLAAALFVLPAAMTDLWPWPITEMLAQLYAAPFLSYGVGSLLIARRRTWLEIRLPLAGMLVFAVAVLLASVIHRELFSAGQLSDIVWFSLLLFACVMLGVLTSCSASRRRALAS
jgi:hypothetical protein